MYKLLMNFKYIVYVTVNLKNSKLYFGIHRTNIDVFDGYIGCGVYSESQAVEKFTFHKAVRKYGYNNFRRITLAVFPDTKEGKLQASSLEKQLINEVSIKSKMIYNEALGGLGGNSANSYKAVYQFAKNGNFLRKFKSIKDAGRYINPKKYLSGAKAISIACNTPGKLYHDCYWSFSSELLLSEELPNTTQRRLKPVAMYSLSGKLLQVFKNQKIAANTMNTTRNKIVAACNLVSQTSLGYQWRYYTGDNNDIPPVMNDFNKHYHRAIIMIDLNGNEIEYTSIAECLKANPQLTAKGISSTLKGVHQISHKGYKFKYKQEDDIV